MPKKSENSSESEKYFNMDDIFDFVEVKTAENRSPTDQIQQSGNFNGQNTSHFVFSHEIICKGNLKYGSCETQESSEISFYEKLNQELEITSDGFHTSIERSEHLQVEYRTQSIEIYPNQSIFATFNASNDFSMKPEHLSEENRAILNSNEFFYPLNEFEESHQAFHQQDCEFEETHQYFDQNFIENHNFNGDGNPAFDLDEVFWPNDVENQRIAALAYEQMLEYIRNNIDPRSYAVDYQTRIEQLDRSRNELNLPPETTNQRNLALEEIKRIQGKRFCRARDRNKFSYEELYERENFRKKRSFPVKITYSDQSSDNKLRNSRSSDRIKLRGDKKVKYYNHTAAAIVQRHNEIQSEQSKLLHSVDEKTELHESVIFSKKDRNNRRSQEKQVEVSERSVEIQTNLDKSQEYFEENGEFVYQEEVLIQNEVLSESPFSENSEVLTLDELRQKEQKRPKRKDNDSFNPE